MRAAATQTDDGNLEIALSETETLTLAGVTLDALTTAARRTNGERPEGAANQTETETDGSESSDSSESSGAGMETDTATQGGETGTEEDQEDTDAGMPTDQGTDTDEGTDEETSEETPDTDTDTHNPPQPVDPATHGGTDGEDVSTDSDDSDRPDSDGTEGGGETSTVTAGTNTNTDNADQQDSDQDNTNTAPAPPVDPNAETEGDSGIDQPDENGTDTPNASGGNDGSNTDQGDAAAGPNANNAPTGSVLITGTVTEDERLTAQTDTLADDDGLGTLNYQWQRSNGNGSFENIENATGQSYSLGDADVGREVRVQVSYTDGNNTSETLTSSPTAEVGTANIAPTGGVRIDGTVRQGQELSADISALRDADGLPDNAEGYRYQWQRTQTDGIFADIGDATEQTYTVEAADLGQRLQVVVRYTDNNGADETLTAATVSPAVTNANDPVIEDDANIVNGTADDDTRLQAAAGSQRINGLAGDDVLIGGAGADILDGGDGKDTAYYFRDSADIEINLETGTGKGGNAEGDVLINIENIVGGNGNDRLTGNNKDNILNGFWGNDRLDGGEGDDDLDGSVGNDTLNGGSGNDRLIGRDDDDILTGGSGNDLFRFRPFDGSDTITDFGTGDDRLQFEFGLFADLEAVRTAATQTDDGNLEITLSETEILTLEGVTLAALTAEAVTTLDREGNDTTTPPADAASDAPAFELDDLAIDEEAITRLADQEAVNLPAPVEPQAPPYAGEKLSSADQTLALTDPLEPPPALALFDAGLEGYAGL